MLMTKPDKRTTNLVSTEYSGPNCYIFIKELFAISSKNGDLKYFYRCDNERHIVSILKNTHLLAHSEVTKFVEKLERNHSIHNKSVIKNYFSGIYSLLEESIK